jgi:hypothetical protein
VGYASPYPRTAQRRLRPHVKALQRRTPGEENILSFKLLSFFDGRENRGIEVALLEAESGEETVFIPPNMKEDKRYHGECQVPLELPLHDLPVLPRPSPKEEKKQPERGVWIVKI